MSKFSLPTVANVESLGILFALLPGLLVYFIVHSLTDREREIKATEAILHGLAYTLLVHAVWTFLTLWAIIPTPDILGLSLCAIGVGITIARINNKGWIYDALRHYGITGASSWSSTWRTSFRFARQSVGTYVILHMKDGRRIRGIVRGYSGEQVSGHVALDHADWLGEDGSIVKAPGLLLFPGEWIRFVQFLPDQGCTK